ncbi:MAG TPA: M56 family metallopeptidase [Pyrinomonadaceae bacterium]
MSFDAFTESEVVAALGWTLLHSLWQIGIVTAGLFIALAALRDHAPNLRYLVTVVALGISVILPVFTFVQISSDSALNPVTTDRNGASVAVASREHYKVSDVVLTERTEPVGATYGNTAADALSYLRGWLNRNVSGLLPLAVLIWLSGVAILSIRLAGGFAQLQRYKSHSPDNLEESWNHTFARLCGLAAVRHKVRLVASDLISTPVAIGIFKPVIVIPATLFLQISPRELELIIAHELIHIRRLDPIVNVAQCVCETLFFYHPGLWWISARIRSEREFATDAAVTSIFEDSHTAYARALANLEEIRLRANEEMPRYATAANGGNFMQRIQKILKIKTEVSRTSSAWTACLALLLTSAFLLALFSATSSDAVNAQQRSGSRKLAIGFVSIPPVDRTENAPKDADATARLLIQKLKEYKVPATGFLQGGMVSDGEKLYPVRANIARMWIDAGFEVGLGGFKHIGLYHTPVDDYITNIEKNEKVAKRLIGDMGLPPRYFSYPFLNTGKTVADRSKVEAWLASRRYTSVKYTIDNQEWMYSYAYDMARNDNDLNTMMEIRDAYLEYMSKMFDHYEAYSHEMFGRDIPQTMVLTPSRLITDTADEFFAMTAKRGYTFVSIDEAQSDVAYKTREDFMGDAGISWFERWTMAKGQKLRHEPDVDPLVRRAWNERKTTAKK